MRRISPSPRPELSVVMVTLNAWEWTQRALEALIDHTDADFELIIVDNASDDGSVERLASTDGVTLLRNRTNLGFGPAVNQAALRARAPYLLLLNTDALVHPGWLPPLRAILDAEPDVAAVAPRLLHLDGSVQEAGSIVWGGGEVWPYGATGDPCRPEYRFRRDVDYASAACQLLRRSAFVDAGGFDPAYAPAYYEDVDLSLTLWSHGLRTVCQPQSQVTHAGGASSDRTARAPVLERNRALLAERWRHVLSRRPPSPVHWEPEDVIPGRDLRCDDRVLVVGDFVPDLRQPHLDGLVRTLLRLWPRARITYLALDADGAEPSAPPLLSAGIELAWPGDPTEWLRQRRHHYGVVLAASWAASVPPVRGLLDSSQPRAHRVMLLDAGAARDLAGEDFAAAVRSARALLCTDEDARSAAAGVHPIAEPVVLDGERALVSALVPLGMAPYR